MNITLFARSLQFYESRKLRANRIASDSVQKRLFRLAGPSPQFAGPRQSVQLHNLGNVLGLRLRCPFRLSVTSIVFFIIRNRHHLPIPPPCGTSGLPCPPLCSGRRGYPNRYRSPSYSPIVTKILKNYTQEGFTIFRFMPAFYVIWSAACSLRLETSFFELPTIFL